MPTQHRPPSTLDPSLYTVYVSHDGCEWHWWGSYAEDDLSAALRKLAEAAKTYAYFRVHPAQVFLEPEVVEKWRIRR